MRTRDVVVHHIPQQRYSARSCIIFCSDYRFQESLERLKSRFPNCDVITATGGAQGLMLTNSPEQVFLLQEINKHYKKGVRLFILTLHMNCKAYRKRFKSDDAEVAFLEGQLRSIRRLVKEHFPLGQFECYLAGFDESHRVALEQ